MSWGMDVVCLIKMPSAGPKENAVMKRTTCMIPAVACLIGLPLGAKAQPAVISDPRPAGQDMDASASLGFVFGIGVHGITGDTLMTGQQLLKEALDCWRARGSERHARFRRPDRGGAACCCGGRAYRR